jgi:catechol 2,3-dioxygenase-like lactoylglutathione lyase family enzyme
MLRTFFLMLAAVVAASSLVAQIPEPPDGGVGMGHLHLRVSEADYPEHKRMLVEGLGARAANLGRLEAFLIRDVVILVSQGDHEGGTVGTSVNHIGFLVKDLAAAEAKWKAAGGTMLPDKPTPSQSYVELPGGIKVELSEKINLEVPISHHHIHFATASDTETQAWYIEMFGVTANTRGPFQTADLPGAELTFMESAPPVVGTQNRGLDHIGFEVKNLEAFCKELEAKGITFGRPYSEIPALGLGIAFFTDPWGTYIELTEGLTQLK